MAELTPRQHGQRLGITRQAVIQAIQRGALKARRVESPMVATGWHWAIDEDEVERYGAKKRKRDRTNPHES